MSDFKIAFDITNGHEGGYANVSGDNGGETYKGVARNFHPTWKGWEIVDRIKKAHPGVTRKELDELLKEDAQLQELVYSFFKANFWDVMRLDEIAFQDIANELYDSGVNFGITPVVRRLQEAINVTRTDVTLDTDGKIAKAPKESNTLKAVNSHKDYKFLYKALNIIQGEAYMEIWRRDPSQEKFVKGWFTRVTFI